MRLKAIAHRSRKLDGPSDQLADHVGRSQAERKRWRDDLLHGVGRFGTWSEDSDDGMGSRSWKVLSMKASMSGVGVPREEISFFLFFKKVCLIV